MLERRLRTELESLRLGTAPPLRKARRLVAFARRVEAAQADLLRTSAICYRSQDLLRGALFVESANSLGKLAAEARNCARQALAARAPTFGSVPIRTV